MASSDLDKLMHSAMPFSRYIGASALSATNDEVRTRVDWQEQLCTAGGVLHGGLLMALADSTGALCAHLNLPEGASTSTIESKTNFLRGVRGGYVEAIARPLHVGRTTVVVDTELRDSAGKLVARTTQTQAVLARGD